MTVYKHMLIVLKASLLSEYATALHIYEATRHDYDRGFCDAIDMCLQQVSNALREADKEEENNE